MKWMVFSVRIRKKNIWTLDTRGLIKFQFEVSGWPLQFWNTRSPEKIMKTCWALTFMLPWINASFTRFQDDVSVSFESCFSDKVHHAFRFLMIMHPFCADCWGRKIVLQAHLFYSLWHHAWCIKMENTAPSTFTKESWMVLITYIIPTWPK
jgi:hypothetical protein